MRTRRFLVGKAAKFWERRQRQNEIVAKYANRVIKRFFHLDGEVYQEGALPAKFKEMLGLCASLVLRCEDCISYHTIRCFEEGVSDAEFAETLSVALVVGGSIVIPHLRGCVEMWHQLKHSDDTQTDRNSGTD